MEVYLDGVFGREYRKLMSAIPAGFGAGRHREDAERPAERVSGRGEGGESGIIEASLRRRGWHLFASSKRVAPVWALIETLLCRRGWHLFRPVPAG